MLSARAIYDEIRNNPETYALFLNMTKWGIIIVVAILALMAFFLV